MRDWEVPRYSDPGPVVSIAGTSAVHSRLGGRNNHVRISPENERNATREGRADDAYNARPNYASPGVESGFQSQAGTPEPQENSLAFAFQRIHHLENILLRQGSELLRINAQVAQQSQVIDYQRAQLAHQGQRLAVLEESLAIIRAEAAHQGSAQTSRSLAQLRGRQLAGAGNLRLDKGMEDNLGGLILACCLFSLLCFLSCLFFLPFDIFLSPGSTAVCFMYVSLPVALLIACFNSPSFVLYA